MTEKNQVYKCEVCGNIVEVLHVGAGDLVCCNQPMILQEENTVDAATEKHVPIIEDLGEGKIRVKVGEVDHPMTEEHKIEWIELVFNEKIIRKNLKPEDKPEKEFTIRSKPFTARAYCNLHGLWRSVTIS
jgi:superoxide reductase